MEIAWKCLKFGFCFFLFHLCNGYPINSEIAAAGHHASLLTQLIAVLLIVCSVVLLAGCLCCQRRNQFKQFDDSTVVASVSSDLDRGHVNPIANGEFTIFTPLSVSNHNNNIFVTGDQVKTQVLENENEGLDLSPWFVASEKDFPRVKLKYIKELGRGWFGKVVEGAAQDFGINKQHWTPVVVRILDATCTQKEKNLFLQDAAIYKCGTHPNILSLIGRCLDTVPFLLLQEYCSQGNLKAYLRHNKSNAEKFLSTEYPLLWSCQVTSALNHLHKNKMVHMDLAARNCQLTSNLILKLGDYGLGPYLYPNDYYQNSLGVPLRWCSPESLVFTQTTIQPHKATPESNVWSLGVTMWEICRCGEQPYSDLTDDDVISKVFGPNNVRLERPSYSGLYTDYIFRLMQLCWTTNAESRPKVTQIDLMLTDLLQVHFHTSGSTSDYVDDFDRRWQSFKPNYIVKTDHISDSVSVEIHDTDISRSPSLSNKHGSLNNLLLENRLECFIEDELSCEPKKSVFETTSSSDSDNEVRKTGKKMHTSSELDSNHFQNLSLFQRMSSGSETEDENWRNKVERGAYTEKVRMKSRSVADLMVLTHVDYSESESETPLPSLDYRVNYKNIRSAPNTNLENVNLSFGSEGNLLSIENTFQEELRKLKEDRRDSLLFVPDNNSHSVLDCQQEPNNNVMNPSRVMEEMNDSTDIKPVNQIYNVFNVTIENYSPIHNKLKEIIFNDECETFDVKDYAENVSINVNKSCDSNLANISLTSSTCSQIVETKGEEDHKFNSAEEQQRYRDEIVRTTTLLIDEVFNEASELVKLRTVPYFSNNSNIINNQVLSSSDNNLNLDKETEISLHALPSIMQITNNFIAKECAVQEVRNDNKNFQSRSDNDGSNFIVRDCDRISSMDEHSDGLENSIETVHHTSDKEIEVCQASEEMSGDIFEGFGTPELFVDKSKLDEKDIPKKIELTIPNALTLVKNDFEKIDDVTDLLDHKLKYENKKDLELNTDINLVPKVMNFLLQPSYPQGSNKSSGYSSEHEIIDQESPNVELIFNESEKYLQRSEEADLVIERNEIHGQTAAVEVPSCQENLSITPEVGDDYESNIVVECDQMESEAEQCSSSNSDYIKNSSNESHDFDGRIDSDKCIEKPEANVVFDVSSNQEEVMPNPLTHSSLFTSTPFRKKEISLPHLQDNDYASINFYSASIDPDNNVSTKCGNKELNYSLETWDNFLGRTLDQSENLFDSFSSEPQSLLFLENRDEVINSSLNKMKLADKIVPMDTVENINIVGDHLEQLPDDQERLLETVVDDVLNRTFTKESPDVIEQSLEDSAESWESSGGWFLHPQTCNDDPVGEMQIQTPATDSYVGFGIDDEIMSAIRNELLSKLPHAQGAPDRMNDDNEWDTGERNEVYLKYNVYNTPLSPIPEESFVEESSDTTTPKLQYGNVDSDWSEQCEQDVFPLDTDSNSALTHESPYIVPSHRHTPSQDSCCSNDTLFNLEELICASSDTDKNIDPLYNSKNELLPELIDDELLKHEGDVDISENLNLTFLIEPVDADYNDISEETTLNCELKSEDRQIVKSNNEVIINFITSEKQHSSQLHENPKTDEEDKSNILFPSNQTVPLPSPEDNPWKQLPASLLNYDKVTAQTNILDFGNEPVPDYVDIVVKDIKVSQQDCKPEENEKIDKIDDDAPSIYENNISDYNDYVNIVNMENVKNTLEYDQLSKDEDLSDEDNVFGVLTDIRFNGPADSQLMSTSFSESNNCDEQDWDSGSDSRSSSSGEFIWKEGEHEESLKVVRAAPQDVMEDVKPMESIAENANEESDISSSFSDDEGETPEFVPSAWDKFAIPGKSVLRSPEKTMNNDEKKPKGVWFKKQKYHCIYEYPREPDSPVLQSQDLWKPQSPTDYRLFADWEFDGETYLPPPSDDNELPLNLNYTQPKNVISTDTDLYHLTNISDLISNDGGLDDEFYISSTSQPFDLPSSLSSQFFPGHSNWVENATPDSGVEDLIGPNNDNEFSNQAKIVPSLKQLASNAVDVRRQINKSNYTMGGLRHTKNKLKLDLPPSPSAFTADKLFLLEPTSLEPVIREKPTFTTFGKSRFFVQHVDTPPDVEKCRNVSFEALPYKPITDELKENELNNTQDLPLERSIIKTNSKDICKLKIEVVRGEASLLDSADEDSGIESSTLERKLSATKSS